MKYAKPEVLMIAPALAVVQGNVKAGLSNPDLKNENSIGAYEADE